MFLCMCEAAGEGKSAVQGTAVASGACCGVTRLMRHWGDLGASGVLLIKIHRIHWCGSMNTCAKKQLATEKEGNQIKYTPLYFSIYSEKHKLKLSFFICVHRELSHPPPLLSPPTAPHIALGPHLRPPFLGMPSALCQAPGES